jgi:hypothetical protein
MVVFALLCYIIYNQADKRRKKVKQHCRVLELADKPSGLGGGEFGIKSSLWRPNRSVEVRTLPLQQSLKDVRAIKIVG